MSDVKVHTPVEIIRCKLLHEMLRSFVHKCIDSQFFHYKIIVGLIHKVGRDSQWFLKVFYSVGTTSRYKKQLTCERIKKNTRHRVVVTNPIQNLNSKLNFYHLISYLIDLSNRCGVRWSCQLTDKQSMPINGLYVSWLCVLSFREEVKEEKDTKVVQCKWYSEVQS